MLKNNITNYDLLNVTNLSKCLLNKIFGKIKGLQHIFDLADVYHSENIDKLSFELTEKHNIESGIFDNVANAKYSIPTHWDIGKVYKRLILILAKKKINHQLTLYQKLITLGCREK